ncbi:unnamed protein product [Ixodes hexagonus]
MRPPPGAPLLLTCLAGSLLVWPSQSLPRGPGRRRPPSSPVERVLRSDGGPGIVLGRAVVVRDDYDRSPPPRRDWCRTGTLMQRVREPGCRTSLLRNRYCYGQCKSFYVPREHVGNSSSSNNTTSGAFESCAACRPVKFRSARVTFVCPGQSPPVRKRTLQRVHRCRCLAVASAVQS